MESLSKTDSLRQALEILGTATGRELANFTGLPIDRVGSLLASDISKGRIVRGWNGKTRCYGMAGTLTDTGSLAGKSGPRYWKNKSIRTTKANSSKLRCLPLGVTNPEFQTLTLKAVALEKQSKYASAGPVWLAAADISMLIVNEQWCLTRAKFCDSAQAKRWGGQP
ncbi:ANR family transcriptional regulator [Yersinia pseudotuberculosis]|uniref:ANR family transcriptional regulator n=2 Tax=Yersinia pseudotuberculosis complex TaxID=1649845 RepID=A0A0H3AZ34_YERPY|nr:MULTISPECIES: ANR family transcriptional regulator [Yersinia pseudotuberculosis complex]AJJ59111.1 hypothetical protein BZ22_796 [Yersinia pseudotuberculosis YPIII]AYW86355.1 ANR family transcriptional regulator [Yersinia pseudotuberculosis]AYX00992.1 ANR family transcriptional regulator [Yersinia pseudotuberculosis]AZA28748.1 ANR family transcriptional regulator [Yersinia pseudotuberculosis]MBK1422598.1 ANR family transcriptional regulator [Yersinia pseudotuberculosis]